MSCSLNLKLHYVHIQLGLLLFAFTHTLFEGFSDLFCFWYFFLFRLIFNSRHWWSDASYRLMFDVKRELLNITLRYVHFQLRYSSHVSVSSHQHDWIKKSKYVVKRKRGGNVHGGVVTNMTDDVEPHMYLNIT